MEVRQIKEQFGRLKHYYLKGDSLRSLGCVVVGLKGIVARGSAPTIELRGIIREALQLLAYDPKIKECCPTPLIYQPGKERKLLGELAHIYKILLDKANTEEWNIAFARKQKLDQSFNLGAKLLAQKQISEADAAFSESISYCKDEYILYKMIAKLLIEAGEARRAATYVKKGLEVLPKDAELHKLFEVVRRAKEQTE